MTQKTIFIIALCLGFVSVLNSCTAESREDYTSREIIVVTLDIEDNPKIEKVVLYSSFRKAADSVSGEELKNIRQVKLKCPQSGEGTYFLCVFSKTDTICSQEGFAEGGYRPTLLLKGHKLKTIRWN